VPFGHITVTPVAASSRSFTSQSRSITLSSSGVLGACSARVVHPCFRRSDCSDFKYLCVDAFIFDALIFDAPMSQIYMYVSHRTFSCANIDMVDDLIQNAPKWRSSTIADIFYSVRWVGDVM
jgi:hypothetical protein